MHRLSGMRPSHLIGIGGLCLAFARLSLYHKKSLNSPVICSAILFSCSELRMTYVTLDRSPFLFRILIPLFVRVA